MNTETLIINNNIDSNFKNGGEPGINSDNRLVDSRNGMGETPLLRAASTGKIPVLKVAYHLHHFFAVFSDFNSITVFVCLCLTASHY